MCLTLMLFSVIVTLLRFVFLIIGYKPSLSDVAFHYTTKVIISTFCSNKQILIAQIGGYTGINYTLCQNAIP